MERANLLPRVQTPIGLIGQRQTRLVVQHGDDRIDCRVDSGDLIEVRALEVTSQDATLRVLLQYAVRRTGEQRRETFERSAGR